MAKTKAQIRSELIAKFKRTVPKKVDIAVRKSDLFKRYQKLLKLYKAASIKRDKRIFLLTKELVIRKQYKKENGKQLTIAKRKYEAALKLLGKKYEKNIMDDFKTNVLPLQLEKAYEKVRKTLIKKIATPVRKKKTNTTKMSAFDLDVRKKPSVIDIDIDNELARADELLSEIDRGIKDTQKIFDTYDKTKKGTRAKRAKKVKKEMKEDDKRRKGVAKLLPQQVKMIKMNNAWAKHKLTDNHLDRKTFMRKWFAENKDLTFDANAMVGLRKQFAEHDTAGWGRHRSDDIFDD